ncbi:MAG TPA: YjgN family protein, partial [Geobacteraceae bacterium]
PPAPAAPRPAGPWRLRFTFTGRAGEYFGIWIMNALLKLVTAGLYSAWAKVRKRRYFFGNTQLHGASFDYLADPMAIFKGWLIAAGLFLLYSFGSRVSPTLGIVLGLLFFLTIPWLVVRSRRFNARNSAYRNIRFAFRPAYREAYVVFAGLYVLLPFTLGLLFPYVIYRQKRFLVEHGSYGATPFAFAATAKDFYRLYFRAGLGLLFIVSLFLLFLTYGAGTVFVDGTAVPTGLGRHPGASGLALAMAFLGPLIYFYIATYVQTAQANLSWNATRLGEARFVSTLRTRDMAWLYFSNAVAVACTLGLLIPWASVRLARYRYDHLALETRAGLDHFLAAAGEEVSATGEEIGDLFGIDLDVAL